MPDLMEQLRGHAASLDTSAVPVTVDEITLRAPRRRRPARLVAVAAVAAMGMLAAVAVQVARRDAAEVKVVNTPPQVEAAVLYYSDGATVVRHEVGTGEERRVLLPGVTEMLVAGDTLFVTAFRPETDGSPFLTTDAFALAANFGQSPVALGESRILVRSLTPNRVWLWDGRWAGELREATPDGTVTATTPAPEVHPVAALPGGFVGDGTVLWSIEHQEPTPVAEKPRRSPHMFIAATGRTVIWVGCDDDAPDVPDTCRLHLTDLDGDDRTILIDWGLWRDLALPAGAVSGDGRTLALAFDKDESHAQLLRIDLESARVLSAEQIPPTDDDEYPFRLAWASGGRCIALTSVHATSVSLTCPDGSRATVRVPARTVIAGR